MTEPSRVIASNIEQFIRNQDDPEWRRRVMEDWREPMRRRYHGPIDEKIFNQTFSLTLRNKILIPFQATQAKQDTNKNYTPTRNHESISNAMFCIHLKWEERAEFLNQFRQDMVNGKIDGIIRVEKEWRGGLIEIKTSSDEGAGWEFWDADGHPITVSGDNYANKYFDSSYDPFIAMSGMRDEYRNFLCTEYSPAEIEQTGTNYEVWINLGAFGGSLWRHHKPYLEYLLKQNVCFAMSSKMKDVYAYHLVRPGPIAPAPVVAPQPQQPSPP